MYSAYSVYSVDCVCVCVCVCGVDDLRDKNKCEEKVNNLGRIKVDKDKGIKRIKKG